MTDSGSGARPDGLWRTAPHATDVIATATDCVTSNASGLERSHESADRRPFPL